MVHGQWTSQEQLAFAHNFIRKTQFVLFNSTGWIAMQIRISCMAFKFESLHIWQKSLELSYEINELARIFPKYEQYNLSNQIRKAADSVNLNIAEGCTGQSNAEFARFLNYSLRSCVEVIGCLFIAKKKNYLSEDKFQYFYNQYQIVVKMITKLRDSLKR